MRSSHRRRRRRHSRSRGYNGSSLVAAAKSNMNVGKIKQAAAFLGGGGANEFLTQLAMRFIPIAQIKSGIGSLGLGLIMSGITGMLAKKFLPGYAGMAATGAVADVLSKGLFMYAPGFAARFTGNTPTVVMAAPVGTTKGYMGDYLTPGDVARARSLGDYLTPGDVARARSLGDDLQDYTVADELAGY